jgi:hypothetical protein
VAVAVLASGCGSSTIGTDVVGPTTSRCGTTATASAATFSHEGGVATVTVGAPRECQWSASTTANWLSLSQSSGRGDATIRITAASNGASAERTARVMIDDRALLFQQQAAPRPPAPDPPSAPDPTPAPPDPPSPRPQPQPPVACVFTFDPARAELGAEAREERVVVRTDAACGWTATSGAPWIVIAAGHKGSGNGEIRYRVSANSVSAARHGSIAVAGHDFPVEQRGTPPPPAACSFELNRTGASFPASGGDGEVRVKADSGCAWDASSAAPWVTIVAGARGSGNGEVRYRVSRNTSSDERAATLVIAGHTYSVRQHGAEPEKPEKVDVKGRVTSLAGDCPNLSLALSSVAVRTSGSTHFKGGNCSHIRVGTMVRVKGVRSGSGPIQAEELRIDR